MELIETRGRKPKYDFSDLKVGETLAFTASGRYLRKGAATPQYGNMVTSRVQAYSYRHKLGWKIARRTLGATVEITRLA